MGVLPDSDSASSRMSVASVNSKRLRKRPREGADSGTDSVLSDTVMPAPKVGTKKRGRGRPATTGKYVGIGQTRREAAAAMKAAAVAEKLEEDERQIAALTKKVMEGRVTRLLESSSAVSDIGVEAEELPASDLNQRMADAVAAIKRVSKVSKGLSGCSQKALKEATASILESAQVLLTRTTTEETVLLRAQNEKLTAQMAELRKEHEELKAEMANFRREQLRREVGLPHATPLPQLPSQPSKQQTSQEMELIRLIRQEMASFNARFSVLEGRILRPPIAADQRSTSATIYAAKAAVPRADQVTAATQKMTAPTAASQKETAGPKSNRQLKKEAKLAKKAGDTAPRVQTVRSGTREPSTRAEAEWTVAGAAKKRKTARQRAKKQAQKEKAADKCQTARLSIPRSTAVVLTLKPGAEERGLTYAGILAKAKAEISLSDLGITGLRCKTTATGGRLLEISGSSSGPKADALADRLRVSLGSDDVRVSRPTKCADLRISGLDDSVTQEEVTAAVSKLGGCPPDQIKTGMIRRGVSGLGTILVSCPVAAAKKIKEKRLLESTGSSTG
ncbi:gag protein [Danaus plexippus plexippus]|uniref:Gag protein n=1 Tax=Danaus plexippus plexippus TaxID=278856 RepID=A0A212EP21_DANPL|nr:gag protein [Danaus plexippus plexippus]